MTPRRILAVTALAVAAIVVLGLVFANPPQCPDDVTPAQIEETGCNIGANIGLGLLFLLAFGVAIAGAALAYARQQSHRNKPPPPARSTTA